jgi:hypothetical protein
MLAIIGEGRAPRFGKILGNSAFRANKFQNTFRFLVFGGGNPEAASS